MSFPVPAWMEEAINRYRRKLGHVKLARQIYEIQDRVRENMAVAQVQICFKDKKVQRLLNRLGVYSDWHPSYLDYARALEKSQREMDWMVDRIRERAILRDRWERRGLDPVILSAIDNLVIYR